MSDIGHKIAKHFGHKIVPVHPALCAIATNLFSSDLAGISIHAQIIIGKEKFNDDLLFTHFGIGGPATYRATVRDLSNGICINLCPDVNMYNIMRSAKQKNGKRTITNIVSEFLPLRLARFLTNNDTRNIADIKDTEIKIVADKINAYKIDYIVNLPGLILPEFMKVNAVTTQGTKKLRITTLDEVVGQQHIIGKDKLLYRAIKADKISSLIFFTASAPSSALPTCSTAVSFFKSSS